MALSETDKHELADLLTERLNGGLTAIAKEAGREGAREVLETHLLVCPVKAEVKSMRSWVRGAGAVLTALVILAGLLAAFI